MWNYLVVTGHGRAMKGRVNRLKGTGAGEVRDTKI